MSIIWCTIGVSGIEAPAIAGDPRAPAAAGDHEAVGIEVAPRGPDAFDRAALDVDPEHLGVGRDRHAGLALAAFPHDRAGAQRVDHAGAGGEERRR